ncbi:MAG: abortive infection family protein [Bacteriovoracaceae bacterium]|nr:abortive infection family protein [Bacteriovoracaceae bacterium]
MGPSLIDIAPSFKQAVNKWPDAIALKQHYDSLELAHSSNSNSTIELTKSFFETVCYTIIEELGAPKPTRASPTTSDIFSCAKRALNIDYIRETNGLGDIISGFNSLSDGLDKLRRFGGSAAHGKDGFIQHISNSHLRTHLLAADSLVSLLLNVLEGIEPNVLTTREPYERFNHLNKKIDQYSRIEAEVNEESGVLEIKVSTTIPDLEGFRIDVLPSAILFELNRPAYKDILQALSSPGVVLPVTELEVEDEMLEAEAESPDIVTDVEELIPAVTQLSTYDGALRDYFEGFINYLREKLTQDDQENVESVASTILSGVESLIVVDWKSRDVVQSQMRLLIKKVLRELSINVSSDLIFDFLVKSLPDQIKGVIE